MEKSESPTSKESPTLTFHWTIFPSVIVGLTAGSLRYDGKLLQCAVWWVGFLRSCWLGWGRRLWLLLGLGLLRGGLLGLRWTESEALEWFNILFVFGKYGDGFSDTETSSIGSDFSNIPFFSRFESDSCFISFDLTNGISDIDLIAFLNAPLDDFTFSHCWRKSWHLFNIKRALHLRHDVLEVMRIRIYSYWWKASLIEYC